ncbi:acyl-CoA thioesterase [filamentous cyanobacterium CCP5]|nr:acyl-CoA thioesterase [filamentous cyanobacterium CCP5]
MERPWFEYWVAVMPHHTDYGGVVWHGTYIAWMESARVEALKAHQSTFADWVAAGIDLPVVDLSIRYRRPLVLGDEALVKTRLQPVKGIRLVWDYEIQHGQTGNTCVQAQVTLIPVDVTSRKPVRRLPPDLAQALKALTP